MSAEPPIWTRPRALWRPAGPAARPDWRKAFDDSAVAAIRAGINRPSDPLDRRALGLLEYRPDLLLRIGPAALRRPEVRALLATHPACALSLVAGFYDEAGPALEPSLAGSGESVYHLLGWADRHGRTLRQPESFYRRTLVTDSYWGHRHARRTRNASLLADLAAWAADERRDYAAAAAYFLAGHPREPVGPFREVLLSNPFYAYLALPVLAGRGFAVTPADVAGEPKWSCHFAQLSCSGTAEAFLPAAALNPGWLIELASSQGWLREPGRRRELVRRVAGCGEHPLGAPALHFLGEDTGPRPAAPRETRPIPAPLSSGQGAEARALAALRMSKNTDVWRPSPGQIHSPAFRSIVGAPHYTRRGLPRGTVIDSIEGGLAEIKSGSSVLDSTYQLRLQTYRSVIEDRPFKIYTNRPIDVEFGQWLSPWGVRIEPLP